MLGPVPVYLTPYHTISTIIGQIVPRRAPLGGFYIYTVRAGAYPGDIWAEDSFEFSVVPQR